MQPRGVLRQGAPMAVPSLLGGTPAYPLR